jgi:HAD superfamily hydrolase (TIGR01509 family)
MVTSSPYSLSPRAILFDLDGTLLDSYALHLKAYQTMFVRLGYQISEETFTATYSPDWRRTYTAMGLPEELWDKADEIWLEEVARLSPPLIQGVPHMLEQLDGTYLLGIVTSGSKRRVARDLDAASIRAYFHVVVTGDDVQARKPAPEGLEIALRALDVSPKQALYVGDTDIDLAMARAAGMPFVGVRGKFASFPPDPGCPLLDTVARLPELLASVSSKNKKSGANHF